MSMNIVEDVLMNLNVWIVVLATGLVVWMIRQVLPDRIENSKVWKILLRLIPMGIGAGIAAIPGLMPVSENVVQSSAIGFIGGSLSQSVYDLFKSMMTERMRVAFASKAGRNLLKSDEEQKTSDE